MAIYTKTGDDGMTSLVGGKRVSKDDIRIASYGSVDELSAEIGLLITYCKDDDDKRFLQQVQRDLFSIGGYLATDLNTTELRERAVVTDEGIEGLEHEIDSLEAALPKLHSFILPGGSRAACVCHVCRTVCRRAERHIVRFINSQELSVDNNALKYINRLSDYLFALSRKLNVDEGVDEVTW